MGVQRFMHHRTAHRIVLNTMLIPALLFSGLSEGFAKGEKDEGMIRGALLHLPGIGPERARRLHGAGITDWRELRADPERLPRGLGDPGRLFELIDRCEQAVTEENLPFLTRTLAVRDQWRILHQYFDRLSFFDIETTGSDIDSAITLIICYHKGKLHQFVADENLDAFLELLEEVELLVSFNGASFDVPWVERTFHIPDLPCAHVDLRWICYHSGLSGGLKRIESELGLSRPPDLEGVDGMEAVWLWERWKYQGDTEARAKLIRYCGADVLSLQMVAARLLQTNDPGFGYTYSADIWRALEQLDLEAPETSSKQQASTQPSDPMQRRLQAKWKSIRSGQ